MDRKLRIQSYYQLLDLLPETERLIVEVLKQIILENLPSNCKEKIAYNVPYFYGKKGIAIIWPATIPRGGIKSGVLLGFWQGYLLEDVHQYLTHGTNKKVFYKIYQSVEEIDVKAIERLIKEAVELDATF